MLNHEHQEPAWPDLSKRDHKPSNNGDKLIAIGRKKKLRWLTPGHPEKQRCSAGYHDVEPDSLTLQRASSYKGSFSESLHFLHGSGVVRLLTLGGVFTALFFRFLGCWNDTECRWCCQCRIECRPHNMSKPYGFLPININHLTFHSATSCCWGSHPWQTHELPCPPLCQFSKPTSIAEVLSCFVENASRYEKGMN